VSGDTKSAEKAYLRRTAGGGWELTKPFSVPGGESVEESSRLIHDFALALQTLRPTPADRILDLGAGGCWASDWLERLNLDVVSLDLSIDMLRVGQRRLRRGRGAPLVAGDMEQLPFAAESFTKAICLNAFHHLPNRAAALAEIRRVLTADGCVLFCEPGAAHSEMPESVAAMRDFGVLERDVVISDVMQACLDAGFADVRLNPISYVIPEFNLTVEQWRHWEQFWRRKRPIRGAQKLWRNCLEILGIGKRELLLEEMFAVGLIRLFKQPVEEHPILVAYRSPYVQWTPPIYRAAFAGTTPVTIGTDGRVSLGLRVTNECNFTWSSQGAGARQVVIGVQLCDDAGAVLDRDHFRYPLTGEVLPGASAAVSLQIPAPPPGRPHIFKVDALIENLTWFEPRGSRTLTLPVHIP
jgi:ubiquinone/menaquinone biosynthesis C-methylase UbiE